MDVVIHGNRMPVTVASVDADGALLRSLESDAQQSAEFWVAFDHIDRVEARQTAVN